MKSTQQAVEVKPRLPSEARGIAILACAAALLLNHSARIAGFNMSLADPLILITFVALLVTGRIVIPRFAIVFFMVVVAVATATVMVITPLLFEVYPNSTEYLADLAKLAACLMYFICGASLALLGIRKIVLEWFAIGTVIIALLGIFLEFTGIRIMSDVLYYGGVRYRGFMADPNFWAVLAVVALAYVARARHWRTLLRWILIGSLATSVILSASKTGMIALVSLCALLLLDKTLASRHRVPATALLLTATLTVVLLWDSVMNLLEASLNSLSGVLPQIGRVSVLLTDPLGAVSEGGSSREAVWEGGLQMIQQSPIVGVGIGSYPAVNEALLGFTTVAHNTYLQLAAEWGLPLALLFLGWLAYILLKATRMGRDLSQGSEILVLRDMIVVFLIGSISLSLNNARMFWLFLGMLVALLMYESGRDARPRIG